MIAQLLLNHFPGWYRDIAVHPENYYLVLSDDMDSFYACRFLSRQFGLEIGGFYSFSEGLYLSEKYVKSSKFPVYVDVSCVQDGVMAFDNHRTIIKNHMSVNPNKAIESMHSYSRKYCGSTLMLVVALYGDLVNLTELEKEFMIAIDSFFIGYYKDGGKYKDVNIYWLEQLGLKETLLPILEKHDAQYFIDLIADYQLKEKIFIQDGELFTYADILPKEHFELIMPVKKVFIDKNALMKYPIATSNLFVAAEYYGDKYVINTLV